jgi:hypothetical protein
MYNHYPTVYHPITKQPVNVYSDEINKLFDTFTEQEVYNLQRLTHCTIFTNIIELDKQIMLYVPFEQLTILCQVNKYSYQLYQARDFWQTYINYYFPTICIYIKLPDDNKIKIYQNLIKTNNVYDYLFYGGVRHKVKCNSDITLKPNYYINLFDNLNIIHTIDKNINKYLIQMFPNFDKTVLVLFADVNSIIYTCKVILNIEQFIVFFNTILMDNVITDIEYK